MENLVGDEVSYKPPDGYLFLAHKESVAVYAYEVPFEASEVVERFGQGERLAYADRGVWTGAALPEPTECPTPEGSKLCGGLCGGCPGDQICTGRSPNHPYGICVRIDAPICSMVDGSDECDRDQGCFSFKVEAEHQEFADDTGFCMEKSVCTLTAQNLPGGGYCDGQ